MNEKVPTSEQLLLEQLRQKNTEIKKLKKKLLNTNWPFWTLFAAFLTVAAFDIFQLIPSF